MQRQLEARGKEAMKLTFEDIKANPPSESSHSESKCIHCGEICAEESVVKDDLNFCCSGCATIYSILAYQESGNLGDIQIPEKDKWAYLVETTIQDLLLKFKEQNHYRVQFDLPQVHCSSCIQILEKLPQLHHAVSSSRLNFPKKQLALSFNPNEITLRQVVELLDFVGYPPSIQLSSEGHSPTSKTNKKLLMQIGVAGFVFGNVMMFSFPAYFNLQNPLFERLFGFMSVALCIPLLTYSAQDYLRSAYAAVLHRTLNIDVPISIGAITLFTRSAYEIFSHTGSGYLDSLSGFIFFLLIGKWIQQRTYNSLSFERGYKHYFPLHATIKKDKNTHYKPLQEVVAGDVLFIRSGELIPCDGILASDKSSIDYSFVTGEEHPVLIDSGEKLFAGGRNLGSPIEILTSKSVDQSYLTSLWEEDAFKQDKLVDHSSFIDVVGKYFTLTILLIAATTLAYWIWADSSLAVHAFTSVLIIACPCVLALSTPFTYGTMRALLTRNKIFFRNTQTLELLYKTSDIIFDKTGTLTTQKVSNVSYEGEKLNKKELSSIAALTHSSTHPLSQAIYNSLHPSIQYEVEEFEEKTGKGIQGKINDLWLRLGSAGFVDHKYKKAQGGSVVYVEIDGHMKGQFIISIPLRTGIQSMVGFLQSKYPMYLLSGDNDANINSLVDSLRIDKNNMHFNQSPFDKLNFIKSLQKTTKRVLMIGDGLNDAGAFRQSDISIVVTEDLNNFTPASDIILQAQKLPMLHHLLQLSSDLHKVIYLMYGFAILYNGIGIWFAVQGLLSPVVAAILMPISSVTIVLIGTLLTHLVFRKNKFNLQ